MMCRYDSLLDGAVHRLRIGVDFTCSLQSLRCQLCRRAKRNNLRIIVRQLDRRTVEVQARESERRLTTITKQGTQ